MHLLTVTDEDAEPDDEEVARSVAGHGCIKVEVVRGSQKSVKRQEDETAFGDTYVPSSSKDVIKGNHVSHSVE